MPSCPLPGRPNRVARADGGGQALCPWMAELPAVVRTAFLARRAFAPIARPPHLPYLYAREEACP
jgi:hypothetical protein